MRARKEAKERKSFFIKSLSIHEGHDTYPGGRCQGENPNFFTSCFFVSFVEKTILTKHPDIYRPSVPAQRPPRPFCGPPRCTLANPSAPVRPRPPARPHPAFAVSKSRCRMAQ